MHIQVNIYYTCVHISYVYMSICHQVGMLVGVCAYIQKYMYTFINRYIHTFMQTYMHIYIYMCMYIHTYIYIVSWATEPAVCLHADAVRK